MLLLGIDLETNGLDVESCHIIEVGYVVWDSEKSKPQIVRNEIIKPTKDYELPDEVSEITGLDKDDIERWGLVFDSVAKEIFHYMCECDYIVAHNAFNFDKPILERHLWAAEGVINYNLDKFFISDWIDSRTDIPFPKHIKQRNLTFLAAEHGFLNPFSHRAFSDVLTMFKILSQYDLNEVIKRAKSPTKRIYANVSFKEKHKAKERGFYWDADKKLWWKDIKECDLEGESFEFPIGKSIVYNGEETITWERTLL